MAGLVLSLHIFDFEVVSMFSADFCDGTSPLSLPPYYCCSIYLMCVF